MVTNTNKSATNQTMTFNDAVWLMEATFNYYHAFTSLEYSKTTADSLFIPVSYNGFSELTTQQVTNLYHDVNNTLVQHLQPLLGSNKKPMVYDFELQATQQGPQVLIITTIGTVNTLKIANQTNSAAFDNTDYWYPTALRGKCDIYKGQFAGIEDASTQWERKLRHAPLPGTWHYTDVICIDYVIAPDDYPGYNQHQIRQTLLMYNFVPCINPTLMNYYFENLNLIIDDIKPETHNVIDIDVFIDYIGYKSTNELARYHEMKINSLTFGYPHKRVFDWDPQLATELP